MLWRKSRKWTQRALGAAEGPFQLSNAPKDGLPEKVTTEQRPKVGERGSCVTNRALRAEATASSKVLSLPNAFGKYQRSHRSGSWSGERRGRTRGAQAQKVTREVTARGVLFLKKQEECNVIISISHEKRAPLITNHPWQHVAEHTPKCQAEHTLLSPAEDFRCPRVQSPPFQRGNSNWREHSLLALAFLSAGHTMRVY